ncbi:ArsR/SmtB family transcription factor [Halobaculum sp. MBLA0147]|uniref:ArsR/SmtB family transcription factor n=1 Tax=Halobaculum sp. MBLA0147 TaxID=3079934 RepID=UPI003526BC1C
MSDSDVDDGDDPDEYAAAFAALSDPNRVAVLRALWDADGHEATFSELRHAVGMRDSGQFNYHLGKLCDTFVRQTEAGTYELRMAGLYTVGSLLAGTYTDDRTVGPRPAGESCPECGAEATFEYDGDWFRLYCTACGTEEGDGETRNGDVASDEAPDGETPDDEAPDGVADGESPEPFAQMPVPGGVFADYEAESVPQVAIDHADATLQTARRGFCPFCHGPTTTTVHVETYDEDEVVTRPRDAQRRADEADRSLAATSVPYTPTDGADDTDHEERPETAPTPSVPHAEFTCERCGEALQAGLGVSLLDHPLVGSLYYDHGRDVREASLVDVFTLDPTRAWIVQTEPLRAVVRYVVDDEAVELVVDDSLEVVETYRGPASEA